MIQLNKNWIQDIADTGRCSSRKFTAIIFLLLIDTYLYFLGLFVFHSYIYQWLEFRGGKPPLILVARFARTNVAEYVR